MQAGDDEMSVHERIMTITYRCDEWKLFTAEKATEFLHDCGISIVGKYRWRTTIPKSSRYGYQPKTDERKTYAVSIDGDEAFVLSYYSEANEAFEQLLNNGFNAGLRHITTTEEYEEWVRPSGSHMHCHFEQLEGEQNYETCPNLKYSDSLRMVPTFTAKNDAFVLEFTISYETDSVRSKKQVKKQLVDIPISDMQHIVRKVELALNSYTTNGYKLETTIDCISYIRSETSAKCEPETIELVMNNATKPS